MDCVLNASEPKKTTRKLESSFIKKVESVPDKESTLSQCLFLSSYKTLKEMEKEVENS